MSFTLKVTAFNLDIVDKRQVHAAMAKRYRQVVLGAFGANGQNRPTMWQPLSPAYAKRIAKSGGQPVPTLYRRGTIFNSIGESASEQMGSVFTFNPLAEYHQFGTDKLPSRPFFPFDRAGNPTRFIQLQMEQVAEREIHRRNA